MANRIDVGGYQLAYHRGGTGCPVVFVAQIGTSGDDWNATIKYLAEQVDALTYDRGGIGDSEPRPFLGPHGYRPLADELAALLDAVRFPRPAVLIGHSVGCHVVRLYADARPADVAGLVMVESSVPRLTLLPGEKPVRTDGNGSGAAAIDARLGEPEVLAARFPSAPAAVVTRARGAWPQNYLDVPGLDDYWLRRQQDLANELRAKQFISERGSHGLTRDDPALIAQAIDSVVHQAREA